MGATFCKQAQRLLAGWVMVAVSAAVPLLPSHAVRVPDPDRASLLALIHPHLEAILRCIWQLPARAWCTCGGMWSGKECTSWHQLLSAPPPVLCPLRWSQEECLVGMLAAPRAALCCLCCSGRSWLSGALQRLQEPEAEEMSSPATREQPGLQRPQPPRPQEIAQLCSAEVMWLMLWLAHTGGAGLQRAQTWAGTGQAPSWAHRTSVLHPADSAAGVQAAPAHLHVAHPAPSLRSPAASVAHPEDLVLACSVLCRW